MTRPPHGVRERKRAAQRQRLYDAALTLFRRNGYDATTIDDIVAKAEVSRGTFFNYYTGKDQVIVEYQRRMGEEIFASLSTRGHATAHAAAQDALRECAVWAHDDPVMARLILRTIFTNADLQTADAANEAGLHEWLVERMTEGVRRGELRASVDVTLLTSLLIGTLSSTVTDWVIGDRAFDLEGVLRRKVTLLFTGARRPRTTAE